MTLLAAEATRPNRAALWLALAKPRLNAPAVEAWLLFGIVVVWQLPHFHSLAWLHRDCP